MKNFQRITFDPSLMGGNLVYAALGLPLVRWSVWLPAVIRCSRFSIYTLI